MVEDQTQEVVRKLIAHHPQLKKQTKIQLIFENKHRPIAQHIGN